MMIPLSLSCKELHTIVHRWDLNVSMTVCASRGKPIKSPSKLLVLNEITVPGTGERESKFCKAIEAT